MKSFAIGILLFVGTANAQTLPNSDVICSYAPSQSAVVNGLVGAAGGASVTTLAIAQATGLSVVAHSSGAYILTGAGGYIAGTLGTAIVAPVIVGVGVVVGGTAVTVEMLCAPKNHPEYVKKVNDAAEEFMRRSRVYWETVSGKLVDVKNEVVPVVDKTRIEVIRVKEDAFAYAYRVTAAGKRAVGMQ